MDDAKTNPTPRRGRWRARIAWAAGLVTIALFVGVVTLDWWLPALGARLAGLESTARETRWGATVSWSNASWTRDGITFTAESMRLDAPTRILRQGTVFNATVDGWVLAVVKGNTPEARADDVTEFGWPQLMDLLDEIGRQTAARVAELRLANGRVLAAGQEFEVRTLTLTGAEISGELIWRGELAEFELSLNKRLAQVRVPAREVQLNLVMPDRSRVTGDFFWVANLAPFSAEFADGSWVPSAFEVNGAEWSVPAELLGLGEEYGVLSGAFTLRRAPEGLSATIEAEVSPLAQGLAPMRINASGGASLETVRLERLEVESPQLQASLSAPLEWRIGEGWAMSTEPAFTWAAELAGLTEGRVSGRAHGEARWSGGADWLIAWDAQAEDVDWKTLTGVAATLRGETTAEATRLIALEARTADGALLEASGRYLHAPRTIQDGVFKAEASGAMLMPWLPAGVNFGAVMIAGKVDGAFADPRVDAQVTVNDLSVANWAVERLELSASGSRATEFALRVAAERGAAHLEIIGLIKPNGATADTLTLRRTDGRELILSAPAQITWAEGRRSVNVAWAGNDTRLQLRWNEGAETAVHIQNLDTSWIESWWTGEAWPRVAVREATVEGRVDANGWIDGSGKVDATWQDEGWVRVEGKAGPEGVNLARLDIGQAAQTLASGAGVVPWRLKTGALTRPEAIDGGEWSLRLDSRAEATLWDELAKLAAVELERPALSLSLSGPARAPSGQVELSAGRIGLRGEGLPEGGLELRDLVVSAEVAVAAVVLKQLTATVDGQRIEADGRLAMADGDWERLRERPYLWLRDHAEARLRLPEAQVAALARYLPTLLAPTGTVEAELRLTPGANIEGSLRLNHGATRPLGGFGVLQDINVELALSGLDVKIVQLRASAGGQAVEITGGARRDPGRMPALDLQVKAERFPLVRKPGLLLRGDLDLAVKTAEAEAATPAAGASTGPKARRTRVSGEVRLRDSLFLADIRPLISAGGGGGSTAAIRARPPYFSVETMPLADWELAVRVGGERFLRMRTPIFAGVASARFDLAGTLREPRAIGEAWVEEGVILFPFASFAVQEGAVRLRASDPYTPTLEFRASGRRLGYDLRLELAGTANTPQLQLYSSPPLEAEKLLLMVTTGTAPTDGQGTASASQRLAAVGAYVGRDLLRTLGIQGTDEERLTLNSGERVSRQGRETYGFEYRLDSKWSLAGEYDEFDAYNVGIKRRLRAERPEADKKEADDER